MIKRHHIGNLPKIIKIITVNTERIMIIQITPIITETQGIPETNIVIKNMEIIVIIHEIRK